MDNVKIAASERTPEVDFDFQNNVFVLRGESYPEDVSAFFGPLVGQFEEHLNGLEDATLRFDFEFIYFNSSTAKIVMGLLDKLDEAAQNGNEVTVRWLYEEDDENMQELGEEFGEDLEHAEFRLEALSD